MFPGVTRLSYLQQYSDEKHEVGIQNPSEKRVKVIWSDTFQEIIFELVYSVERYSVGKDIKIRRSKNKAERK